MLGHKWIYTHIVDISWPIWVILEREHHMMLFTEFCGNKSSESEVSSHRDED